MITVLVIIPVIFAVFFIERKISSWKIRMTLNLFVVFLVGLLTLSIAIKLGSSIERARMTILLSHLFTELDQSEEYVRHAKIKSLKGLTVDDQYYRDVHSWLGEQEDNQDGTPKMLERPAK